MRHREEARSMLLGASVFVALTSIACGVGLVMGAVQFPLAFLRGTPFSDYTLPGLVMAIAVGGSALLAAVALGAGRTEGIGLAALAGLILLLFEGAEIASIDRNVDDALPLVVALQSVYSALGLTILVIAGVLREPGQGWRLVPLQHAHSG